MPFLFLNQIPHLLIKLVVFFSRYKKAWFSSWYVKERETFKRTVNKTTPRIRAASEASKCDGAAARIRAASETSKCHGSAARICWGLVTPTAQYTLHYIRRCLPKTKKPIPEEFIAFTREKLMPFSCSVC